MSAAMCGIPVALVAVANFIASAGRRRRDRLIEMTGQRAIGRILAMGRDSDDLGGSPYWVKVQYDYDGEPVTVRVVVSWRDQEQYRVGQRIGLTYAPSRPRVINLDPPQWALRRAP
jgi:hypothetical protein